jgi:hypothetical protein
MLVAVCVVCGVWCDVRCGVCVFSFIFRVFRFSVFGFTSARQLTINGVANSLNCMSNSLTRRANFNLKYSWHVTHQFSVCIDVAIMSILLKMMKHRDLSLAIAGLLSRYHVRYV